MKVREEKHQIADHVWQYNGWFTTPHAEWSSSEKVQRRCNPFKKLSIYSKSSSIDIPDVDSEHPPQGLPLPPIFSSTNLSKSVVNSNDRGQNFPQSRQIPSCAAVN
jgi:hypothetical protein